MTLSDYQDWASQVTCFKAFPEVHSMYKDISGLNDTNRKKWMSLYFASGLTTEVGEVVDVIHKSFREPHPPSTLLLAEELGDTLAWISVLANLYNIDLEDVLERTRMKLHEKYKLHD